jgi:hypothetical protein
MKKLILLGAVASLLYGTTVSAQSSFATTNSLIPPQFLGFNGTGPGGAKTLQIRNNYNLPIEMYTNGIQRMHINQNKTLGVANAIDGFQVNTSGFVGIGPNTGNLWNTTGPFTLLHLNGETAPGDFAQQWGYRPWMRTGISFTDQVDYSYVGYRSVDASANLNEFTISWGNDLIPASSPISAGPDDMVFRFVAAIGDDVVPNPPTGDRGSADFSTNDDFDGRHIARFTPLGFFGLGPNFGHTVDNAAYVRPQSMFHMSTFQQQEAWMQVTNQTGTGETTNDGLRIGVTGTGTAHIKQQEELPLIFYTNNLSTARIVPEQSSYITSQSIANPGMMGIGDFTTPSLPIDAKLDIDGDLRIRLVNENNALTRVLVVDENDQNRVFYRNVDDLGTDDQNLTLLNGILSIEDGNSVDLSSLDTDAQTLSFNGSGELCISNGNCVPLPPSSGGGTVTANNGLRIFPANSGNVRLGGILLEPTNIDMASFNMNFTNTGRFYIGGTGNSKLVVRNDATPWNNIVMFNSSTGLNRMSVAESGLTTINSTDAQALGINFTAVSGISVVNTRTMTTIDDNSFTGSSVTGIRAGFTPNTQFSGTEIGFSSSPNGTSSENIGFHALINSQTTRTNTGFRSFISNGDENFGANVWARGGQEATGIVAIADGAPLNIGIRASASGQAGTTSWAGWFQGAVHVTGQISSTNGTIILSDQLFKTNINPISNASSIINQLQPKVYNLDSANFTQFGFDNKQHMGLIAQEVELILPNLVSNNIILAQTDSLGNEITPQVNYKGLNYQELIPLMIAGMKEQQQVINDLKATVENLESCIRNANICEEGNRAINQNPATETNYRSVELTNNNSIILDQNSPNPFAENTIINYNIPTDVVEAKLMFYDLNGRIIKELIIEERGESKLTVYGTNLKTGVYTYSLIADGELIATKKMVKK